MVSLSFGGWRDSGGEGRPRYRKIVYEAPFDSVTESATIALPGHILRLLALEAMIENHPLL